MLNSKVLDTVIQRMVLATGLFMVAVSLIWFAAKLASTQEHLGWGVQSQADPATLQLPDSLLDQMQKAAQVTAGRDGDNDAGLLNLPSRGSGLYTVNPEYYLVWDDLIRRCWDSIATASPYNSAGLTSKSKKEIQHEVRGLRRRWFSEEDAFVVRFEVYGGRKEEELRRSCTVTTSGYFPLALEDLKKLKTRYDAWWDAERLVSNSTQIPYTGRHSANSAFHGARTKFGSRRGCGMEIVFRGWTVKSKPGAEFQVAETSRGKCDLPSFGSGKVRVHRLPQLLD